MRLILPLLLSALALPAASSARQTLPDLGDVPPSELSPRPSSRIGEQIIREIRWRDAAYLRRPAEVEEYVNRLGQRLAAVSNNPGWTSSSSGCATRHAQRLRAAGGLHRRAYRA
jgi:predicted Zn-dependent protease